jgi:hypothetical protein
MTEPLADDSPKSKWTWQEFWLRFKSKDLGEIDNDPLFWRVFIPAAFLGAIGWLFIDAEGAAGDWMTDVTLTYLWPPFTALGWVLVYRTKGWRQHWGLRLWLILAPIPMGGIAAFCMGGFPILANALTGGTERVYVAGPVIEKKGGSGARFTGYNYYLTIRYEGRPVCLTVSKADYDSHPVGWTFGREMRRGGYGYFYEWYFGSSWR